MTLTADRARTLTAEEIFELAYGYVLRKPVSCPEDGAEMAVFLSGEPATADLVFRCPRCGTAGAFTRDM